MSVALIAWLAMAGPPTPEDGFDFDPEPATSRLLGADTVAQACAAVARCPWTYVPTDAGLVSACVLADGLGRDGLRHPAVAWLLAAARTGSWNPPTRARIEEVAATPLACDAPPVPTWDSSGSGSRKLPTGCVVTERLDRVVADHATTLDPGAVEMTCVMGGLDVTIEAQAAASGPAVAVDWRVEGILRATQAHRNRPPSMALLQVRRRGSSARPISSWRRPTASSGRSCWTACIRTCARKPPTRSGPLG